MVWMTAGLGCDGDSVSITAATQPSIEDVLLGAIPGLAQSSPCTIRCSPTKTATIFSNFGIWRRRVKLDPFVLVVEGSIPNEKIKKEGYWAALGTDPKTNQPIND